MSRDGNKRFSLSRSLRVLALCVALAAVMVDVQASRAGFGRSPTEMLHFPELDTGFQLLYQLKFGGARAQFEKWQTSHPEGALGYASEAASYLFEESYRSGILTSDFFLDDKRFLGTTPVKPDPKLQEAFFDSNKRAQDVAQFRLKENADNPNALFAMAISLGMQADYAGLIEKHQLDSLKKTREADTYSKKLLKVVPDAYDAYLGLGTANYIIGSLPGSKKFFVGFAGIHGDKKKGIQQLEITAKEGHYLRPFAKVLLALTALREKKPEMARTEFTELVSEFPENPLFAGELAKLNGSTNNKDRLNDPEYLGWRHERITGQPYFDFVDQFVQAMKQELSKTSLQSEDFATPHARPILQRYRDELLTFNDDIQGTAAVALGAILGAVKVTGKSLKDLQIVMLGAGSAGIGVADELRAAMREEGLSEQEARSHFWVIDIDGLLHSGRKDLSPEQSVYAQPEYRVSGWPRASNGHVGLADVIGKIDATILIGLSTVGGAFSESIVREMARKVQRPIIFPLSNPTSKSKAKPDDLIQWTEGRALAATGSPFPPSIMPVKLFRSRSATTSFSFLPWDSE